MTPLIPFPPPEITVWETIPALVAEVSGDHTTSETEIGDSSYLPGGVEYRSITVPPANLSEDAELRREVRDLFGDED